MKSKIQNNYPQSIFCNSRALKIYVVDFTERTGSKRKVEIHETIPQVPNSNKNMDCLMLENPSQVSVICNIFDDSQFKDNNGKDMQHCECILFPESEQDNIGTAFVEIKDCRAKNISVYKKKVKEQIISTVQVFRDKSIIERRESVYGIISFPRRNKLSFNQTIFDDATEYKYLHKKYRIRFFPTNYVTIVNEKKLAFHSH